MNSDLCQFMSSDNKNKIVLIDGYGFVFRAFHSLPPLTRADGTPVGAVYGFTNMLLKLLANIHASHIAVVFDSGSKTFRNDIYPAYKANRPPCPEELKPQFPIVREVAEAMNLSVLEKVGFEADDLIATVSTQAKNSDFEVIIVSSDKDLMQLVGGPVKMFDAMKNKMISEAEVEEKFFVKPNQVLDVLSLMGDSSDNVPGVRGIGPKTAAELILQYQTLENLLEHLSEIKQEKRRQMLIDGTANAKLSKELIKLDHNVPMSSVLDDYKLRNIDGQKLVDFLEKQGFKALMAKVKKEFNITDSTANSLFGTSPKVQLWEKPQAPAPDKTTSEFRQNDNGKKFENITKTIIADLAELKICLEKSKKDGALFIDYIFDKATPKAFTLSSAKEFESVSEIFLVNIIDEKNHEVSGDLFSGKSEEQDNSQGLKLAEFASLLLPTLLDDSITKIGFDVKELVKFFRICDDFHDLAVMSYILNSGTNKTDFDVVVAENLSDETPADFSINCQKLDKGRIPEAFAYDAKKLEFYFFKNFAIGKIYANLKQKIFEAQLNNVYYSFERPLVNVLASIENNGIAVDKMALSGLSTYFDEEIKNLNIEIYREAGEEFNIGSTQQLAHILFEKLSLKSGRKSSKTGAYSTDSEVLEELNLEGHNIAKFILEWRKFSKLKSTYTDALQTAINPKTGRIHTTFSNISTTTGRLSSNNPNLQNIPIRTAEGRKIRSCFIAPKGSQLISADYSQIELRVLADMAGIDALKQAFLEDKDIHAITAAQVFEVPESEVDSEMRRRAKAINFGIVYGISAFGLAAQLGIDRTSAAKYIENYFKTYPGIQKYMQEYKEYARTNGYVKTISGRKCFVPNSDSKNQMLRGLADRFAINAPIQGSAADIIKKAMIDFDKILQEKNLKSKMVLQVHDELVVEAPDDEVEQVKDLLCKTMRDAIVLGVPLKIDVTVATKWE